MPDNKPTTEVSITNDAAEWLESRNELVVSQLDAADLADCFYDSQPILDGLTAAYKRGRDDANALTAKDAKEKDREVSQMAAQVQELKATLDTMKYWMAIDKCDCDTERKDGHTVRMDYPKSLELDWHLEDCYY